MSCEISYGNCQISIVQEHITHTFMLNHIRNITACWVNEHCDCRMKWCCRKHIVLCILRSLMEIWKQRHLRCFLIKRNLVAVYLCITKLSFLSGQIQWKCMVTCHSYQSAAVAHGILYYKADWINMMIVMVISGWKVFDSFIECGNHRSSWIYIHDKM